MRDTVNEPIPVSRTLPRFSLMLAASQKLPKDPSIQLSGDLRSSGEDRRQKASPMRRSLRSPQCLWLDEIQVFMEEQTVTVKDEDCSSTSEKLPRDTRQTKCRVIQLTVFLLPWWLSQET